MNKTNRNIGLVLVSAMGFVRPAVAQKQVTHQSQYWMRYYGKYQLSPDWQIHLEVDDRRFFDGNRQANWVLPRVAIDRKLGAGWHAGAGFTYYTSTNPADPSKPIGVTVPELRPHQYLTYKQEIKDLEIGQRFQIEERWTHNSTSTELVDGYKFAGRFRYQLQLNYPLIKKETPAGTLKVVGSDEIMLNVGHSVAVNTFDQNRLYFALNYGILNSLQVELGYMNQFQERSTGTQYYGRNNLRLTIYHTLKFY